MANRLVSAVDTLIRFRNGRFLIHTTSSKLPTFESESPMLVGWLCQFSKPTVAEAAIAALQPSDRPAAAPAVDYLKRSGALVDADAPAAAAPGDAELMARTKNHLRLLARSLYDTACDLLSFGPYAEGQMLKRTGAGVERRLMALLAAIDGLRSELTALRPDYVAPQIAALGTDLAGREHQLHIGCGKNTLDGGSTSTYFRHRWL